MNYQLEAESTLKKEMELMLKEKKELLTELAKHRKERAAMKITDQPTVIGKGP